MIDLILWANTRQTLAQFSRTNGLMRRDRTVTAVDPDTGAETVEFGEWELRPGVSWSPWNGSGKMMRRPAVLDAEGNVQTPPVYVPGYVGLIRIAHTAGAEDRLDSDDPDDQSEWRRSKIARYIRNNGQSGQVQGINYSEMDGVRIFRRSDVETKLKEWGVPSHVFL